MGFGDAESQVGHRTTEKKPKSTTQHNDHRGQDTKIFSVGPGPRRKTAIEERGGIAGLIEDDVASEEWKVQGSQTQKL